MSDTKHTIRVRWAVRSDLPGAAKVEAETLGDWGVAEFERVLSGKGVFCYVATVGDGRGEHVVGFVVMEVGKWEARVINMACTYPPARPLLIEKAEKRAGRHQLPLAWETP